MLLIKYNMSTFLKKSLITIITGFAVAWISSTAPLAFGVNYRPIYANNTLQMKAGPLAIGKNYNNPTPGFSLEIPGIVLTNGFLSRGTSGINQGVNISGNLKVNTLFLFNSVNGSSPTASPLPACIDTTGLIVNC